jgi:hypothetical protein
VGVEFRKGEIMRKHVKKDNSVKIIYVAKGEAVPKGFMAITGFNFPDKEMEAYLPEKIVKENPSLAKKLADQAEEYFIKLLSELGMI